MYDITITISTNKDPGNIVQEIAALVEAATGEQCRVTLLNKRSENQYLAEQRKNIVNKLESKGNYAKSNTSIS